MTIAGAINQRMTAVEWGLLVTLSVLWGGSFFFNGVAVRELPPLTIVFCRVALAALLLLAVSRLTGRQVPRDRRLWAAFLGMGVLNNVIPFTLIVWGQGHIASGVASILNATTPLFTVIVAHLLLADEKLTRARFAGVVMGFAGVAVMVGVDAFATLGVGFNIALLAQLACLGAAISYAFSGAFGRRFRGLGVTPMVTATGQLTASSMLMLPLVLVIDQPWTLPAPGPATVAALLGLATVSTALAYILFFRLLATAGATNLLLVTLLIPVSASLLGVGFLGEKLLAQHILGMAMIACGLAVMDGRLWSAVSRRRAPSPLDMRGDGI